MVMNDMVMESSVESSLPSVVMESLLPSVVMESSLLPSVGSLISFDIVQTWESLEQRRPLVVPGFCADTRASHVGQCAC